MKLCRDSPPVLLVCRLMNMIPQGFLSSITKGSCLEKFLRKYDLLPIVSLGSVATWVREGKRAQQGSGVDTTGV